MPGPTTHIDTAIVSERKWGLVALPTIHTKSQLVAGHLEGALIRHSLQADLGQGAQ